MVHRAAGVPVSWKVTKENKELAMHSVARKNIVEAVLYILFVNNIIYHICVLLLLY